MSEAIKQLKIDSKEMIPEKLEGFVLNDEKGTETHKDLVQLVEKRIAGASLIADSLESSGKNRLEEIKNSVKISGDKLNNSGVKLGMEKIRAKAEDLLENLKAKLKMAVAIGMATMAFSGVGDFEKQRNNSTEAKKTIELVENGNMSEEEKKALAEYEKDLEDVKNFENSFDPRPGAEEVKRELKIHIRSQEYLNKLKVEFEGDINKAKKIQEERASYLDTIKINFTSKDIDNAWAKYGMPQFIKDNENINFPKWYIDLRENAIGIKGVAGFYDQTEHKITLPNFKDKNTIRHELFHASTKADKGIPEKTKKIFKTSYEKLGNDGDEYYDWATERLVRKQELDLEMERLGIKKYGEEFTDEHYKKLVELDKENKLSMDAHDFMRTTKPEYFKQIFNEIAVNESVNSNPVKQV